MKSAPKINKDQVLRKAKNFFKKTVAVNHINNLKKLKSLKEFRYNPFLLDYLATFLTGRSDAKSIAKALVYPRILGTSITTSFGQNIQKFCSSVLSGFGSTASGIDIEFVDNVDGRKKYCQVKAGPQTINKDDITTIKSHFRSIRNLARTNNLDVRLDDLIIGVLYGSVDELSANYLAVQKDYPVYVGEMFWHRLTGDKDFYFDLIEAFGSVAKKADAKNLLNKIIDDLSKEVQAKIIDPS